ncbi:MAG TPA: hypothetical protein VIJ18_13160 [Microbacteriaceae bacterium]
MLRWAATYTRGLPAEVAATRMVELASDIYEQGAAAGASRKEQRKVAREIMLRAFRGLISDLSWREHELRRPHNRTVARSPAPLFDAEFPPIQPKVIPRCAAELQTLMTILDEAVAAANAADALLTLADRQARPEPDDARLGLHLRFRFVNLQHALAELRYCPEHSPTRNQTAALLAFYLYMITSAFEVRFSPLARDQYVVLAHDPGRQTTSSKLVSLRNELQRALTVVVA